MIVVAMVRLRGGATLEPLEPEFHFGTAICPAESKHTEIAKSCEKRPCEIARDSSRDSSREFPPAKSRAILNRTLYWVPRTGHFIRFRETGHFMGPCRPSIILSAAPDTLRECLAPRIARTARNIEIAAHQPRLSARPWKCRSAALPQQNPNWPRPAVNGRRDGPPYCPPTPRAVQLESARRQLLARSQHAADRLLTARVLAARDGAGAHFRPFSGADGLGGHHHRDWDPRFGLGGPGHPSRCVVARCLGVLASLPASPPRARLGRHR